MNHKLDNVNPKLDKVYPKWESNQFGLAYEAVRAHLGGRKKLIGLFDILVNDAIARLGDPGVAILYKEQVHEEEIDEIYPGQEDHRQDPDSSLRSHKKLLKSILEEFKDTSKSKRLAFRFEVNSKRGVYSLDIIDQFPAVKCFWGPYFACSSVRIIYAENLFFRTGKKDRAFIRHMNVNDPTTGPKDIRREWLREGGKPLLSELKPGRYFVPAGEAAAVAALVQCFECNGLPTHISKAHEFDPLNRTVNEGTIIIGNIRSIDWLCEPLNEAGGQYRILEDGIRDIKKGRTYPDPPPLRKAQGLIVRTKSPGLGWLTILASNHGRFSEEYSARLFSHQYLIELFNEMKWSDSAELPGRFDVLRTVNLTSGEERNIWAKSERRKPRNRRSG